MSDDLSNSYEKTLFSAYKVDCTNSKVGFEKESLRISNSNISQLEHPKKLGSSLCNKYITTDFSEAQLEMVTPPFHNKYEAIEFLDDIHQFVSLNLNRELIWPLSIPMHIISDEEIPIASYGSSNTAKLKHLYRAGLSFRYGKLMQSISGLHYNFSVPNTIFSEDLSSDLGLDQKELRSSLYINQLRNIYRLNWFIVYLFGASPVITRNFLINNDQKFKKIDDNSFYLPNATSLRMSSYGYQNKRRTKLQVSLDSIGEYISDLRTATETLDPKFKDLSKTNSTNKIQINNNILQIDDEYYAVARAKSIDLSNKRTTSKLREGGVDFLELRSLDLNPFSRLGIEKETVFFLEMLLIHCFVKQDGVLTAHEIESITSNEELIATKGRESNLQLIRKGNKVKKEDWGKEICDQLLPIADFLDHEDKQYTRALRIMKERVTNPSSTASARILDEILSKNYTYSKFGMELAETHKEQYSSRKKQNKNWQALEHEAEDSLSKQQSMENIIEESLEDFLEKYFLS